MIAPLVFRTVIEYPLMVAAACLLRIGPTSTAALLRTRRLDWLLPIILAVVALAAAVGLNASAWKGWAGLALLFLLVTVVNITFWRRPTRFALGYVVSLVAFGLYARLDEGDLLHVERNYFGVKKVVSVRQGRFHVLYHGTTVHGIEDMAEMHVNEPLAYYHRTGPVGEVFQFLSYQEEDPDVAAIGLGAGAVASYAKPGQSFDFYEIDPGVARIATDPRYFRYLSRSPGTCKVILGDGRLALANLPKNRYGLIFLDAYSSDAVPTHLLSREAVQLYLDKLQPHGLLMFHITNRFMNLEPIVAGLARDACLAGLVRAQKADELTADQQAGGCTPAHVVVLARRIEDLGMLAQSGHWRPLATDPTTRVWTDQYSDVISPFLDKMRSDH